MSTVRCVRARGPLRGRGRGKAVGALVGCSRARRGSSRRRGAAAETTAMSTTSATKLMGRDSLSRTTYTTRRGDGKTGKTFPSRLDGPRPRFYHGGPLIVRILGSAAGGGFPQWNCGCPNCRGVRAGGIRARARTQECVAVSADGAAWLLLNCSPEIRAQIESFPPLHPRAPRDCPIAAILLTNGDLDHCLGLLSLR